MKIAIAGYGVEGRSSYTYFRKKFPEATIIIADKNRPIDPPADTEIRVGDTVFQDGLLGVDLIVRSPSLPPQSIHSDAKIWSATNEFFAECPALIIGVSGTKGKGTTCSFITSILRAAGKRVHLVGNIGVPALDKLPEIAPDDIVVYELSSFQLWDAQRSPHISVILMIEPDHLDKHESFEEYVEAKSQIAAHQLASDVIIYNKDNKYSTEIAEKSPGTKIQYPYDLPDDILSAIVLPGKHNKENACAAIAAVRVVIPDIKDDEIKNGLRDFSGLPHRLKFVAEYDSVRYYDDSIATTPGSAIAAIRSFEAPKILLLGGSDKGADYTELAREIAATPTMRSVILSGKNESQIADALHVAQVSCEIIRLGMTSMDEMVEKSKQVSRSGDVVILSPAAASFDRFKSYADRGDQFIAAVNALH